VNKKKVNLSKPAEKQDRIVVVGAGLAGLRTAERLRETGFGGELVLVGAERGRPYHRPALSKQLLTGELRTRDLTLRSYVPLGAIWRRGACVLKLDTRRHVVELAGDEEIRYDGLVIATGVQARHLHGAPRHDPRVHVLRTMGDAIRLQRCIATGNGKVVVIGGGFTACEVASTAKELGCDVTIVSRSNVLLGKVVGDELGNEIAELHRDNGVRVETDVEVTDWQPQPWGITMRLSNGKLVAAGTVVLAVGSTPAVQWLRGSGLTLEDGVLCRPTCHVVGANDIVAAGDVARWPNLRFEATPRRVEHWMNAVDMGRAAAESLLAGPAEAKPFTPLPRFWSEQHGMHLQAAGMPALGQDTVTLGNKSGKGITGYGRNGRLIGIVGRNNPRGMLRWTEELKRELRRPETVTMPAIPVEPEAVAEPEPQPPARPEPVPVHELTQEHPELAEFFARLPPEPVDWTRETTREHPELAELFGEHPPMTTMRPVPRPMPGNRPPRPSRADPRPVPRPMAPPPRTQPPVPPPTARPTGQPVARQRVEPPEELTLEHPEMAAFFADLAPDERPPMARQRPAPGPAPRPHPLLRNTPDPRPPHPSMPNMQPVPRPDDRPPHPSMPNMHPVPKPESMAGTERGPGHAARQLPSFPDMPRYGEHPSMPNLRPVAHMSEFERRREQQLLEWQFRQD
jgi:NADPH-dependent 2,4-dienoyl-CoA reductase/sulfur reductase-like enzyme